MHFYLIGIDYKQAPLDSRESVYRKRALINALINRCLPGKAVILSTCNRFEIYGFNLRESDTLKDIVFIRMQFPELSGGYVRLGINEVSRHLTRLASGLESQLKGELQIGQQLQQWAHQPDFPEELKGYVEEALFLAKNVRREAGLFLEEHNAAAAVFYDLKKQIPPLLKPEVIIAGTGKIAELFARYKPAGVQLYFAARRNIGRAKELAGIAQAEAVRLGDISGLLETADGLVSASASPHHIFFKEDFAGLKRAKPFYLYDIAVPADIEPAVGQIEGMVLKNLNALTGVFEEFNARLFAQVKLAEYLIENALREKQGVMYGQGLKNRRAAEFTRA